MARVTFLPNCHITAVSDGCGTTRFAVRGELDVSSAPALRAQISSAVGSGDTRIVIDLSMASFVDAVALGVLVASWRRVRGVGGELILAAVSRPVRRVLEVTRLAELLGSPGSSARVTAADRVPLRGASATAPIEVETLEGDAPDSVLELAVAAR